MKKLLILFFLILPLTGCGNIIDGFNTTNSNNGGDYMYDIEEKEVTIVSLYDNHQENVVIPSIIEGYPVKRIENNACKNFKNLKSISLPSSLEYIGTNVLTGCTNLKEITIPFTDEASYLKYYFGGMEDTALIPLSLKTVYISEGVTKIYADGFYGCDSIEKVYIPSSVTEINARSFKNCLSLKAIYFSGDLSLTTLDSSSLDIERLVDTEIIDEVQKDMMIKPCIIVGNMVSQAYKNFFEDCFGSNTILNIYKDELIVDDFLVQNHEIIRYLGSKTEVTIDDSITTIGKYAFANDKVITSIELGAEVIDIKSNAFYNMDNLTTIKLNDKLQTISDYAFSYCGELINITLPMSIKKIGHEVFGDCEKLTEITLPCSLTELGSYVFKNANSDLVINVSFTVTNIPELWQSDWCRGILPTNIIYSE